MVCMEDKGGSEDAGNGNRPGDGYLRFWCHRRDGSRLKPVTYGTIQTTPDHTDAERLVMLFDGLNELYRKYKPDVIGVEQLFFNRNVTTAITVGQARGIILLTAQQAGIPILEFSPLQVKQGVTGYGRATKEQVIDMTMRLLASARKSSPTMRPTAWPWPFTRFIPVIL